MYDVMHRIMGLLEAETSLTASNEALRAENDMTKEQLISIRAKLDTINEQTGVRIPDTGSKSVQVGRYSYVSPLVTCSLHRLTW